MVGPFCEGDNIPSLSTTSLEGINGSWSPATDNTQTTTYTFIPDVGQCATMAMMDIEIDPAIQSTFTQLGPYCEGDVGDILSLTSLEGLSGVWSPSSINTGAVGTTTYTFTVDVGQCALGTTMDITIDPIQQSTFTQLGPYCEGDVGGTPLTSLKGLREYGHLH